jgi:type I restriction enzyme M protein
VSRRALEKGRSKNARGEPSNIDLLSAKLPLGVAEVRSAPLMSTPPSFAFAAAKSEFDAKHATAMHAQCIVPVRGKPHAPISIRAASGQPNEEFYKWQFVNAIVLSGLYPKDYIGVEVHFPKGNKTSAPLKLDAAVFDDPNWVDHYNAYWENRKPADLEWLNEHLVAVAEFKKGDKEIEKVFTGQVKPAMREKEPADAYVLGVYYDTERLYLFQRKNGIVLRYDESKNQKGEASKVGDLSLHLPDAYAYMPGLDDLKRRINRPSALDRSKRGILDLDVITSIASVQIQTAFSDVLRALDKTGLVNQRGYAILIQTLALKIFDEKRNERSPQRHLEFYVTDTEAHYHGLAETPIQGFITRMKAIREDASSLYRKILGTRTSIGKTRAMSARSSPSAERSRITRSRDLQRAICTNLYSTTSRTRSNATRRRNS